MFAKPCLKGSFFLSHQHTPQIKIVKILDIREGAWEKKTCAMYIVVGWLPMCETKVTIDNRYIA